MKKRIFSLLLALLLIFTCIGALAEPVLSDDEIIVDTDEWTAMDDVSFVEYGADYIDPYEVALYLHCFEELPPNFITKNAARKLGWDSRDGNLWEVAYGTSIGGDIFGNREGLLPDARGRKWYECDVNYTGGYRGAERLLFSSDGLICYSDDHYRTYTELYDGWYFEDGYFRGNGGKY